MPRRTASCLLIAAALTIAGSTGATAGFDAWFGWFDLCRCNAYAPYGYYGPAPVYVYDNSRGAVWTSNGWSYPPVGAYYPGPPPQPPYVGPRVREVWPAPPPPAGQPLK